jgi:hypothetical protein
LVQVLDSLLYITTLPEVFLVFAPTASCLASDEISVLLPKLKISLDDELPFITVVSVQVPLARVKM